MPTSGVTTWELTANDVVTAAMQEIGVLDAGEVPEASEITDGILRLNGMLKSWSVRGNLFREATGEITVPGGSGSGALPQGVRDVSAVRLVVDSDYERPLQPWPRGTYFNIPNRLTSGDPTTYYLSKGISGVTLNIWPVPVADKTLKIDYSRAADTVTEGAETLDVPQEWQETVIKALAVRIANMFVGTIDPVKLQKVAQEASELERMMLDADRPDAYIFEPWDGYC